jgi:hypothetical protein
MFFGVGIALTCAAQIQDDSFMKLFAPFVMGLGAGFYVRD